jgi:hypothetical protein
MDKIKEIIDKANQFSIDAVSVRDQLLQLDKKIEVIEAHRDRVRKALAEIEAHVNESTETLEKAYNEQTWIPIGVKVDSDTTHPVPTYFDGLAYFVEKLRPIIQGAK